MKDYWRRLNLTVPSPQCRGCLRTDALTCFLDMGRLPLANKLSAHKYSIEKKYPLRIGYCSNCELVQLMDEVPPEDMFSEYLYQTGASNPMVDHFNDYAKWLMDKLWLRQGDTVLDIGSNDGTFLRALKNTGLSPYGVEPAGNLAEYCQKEGLSVFIDYFGSDTLEKFGADRPKVITANNVLTHVPKLHSFIRAVSDSLGDHGSFVFEVPFFPAILENNTFDMFYHEHVTYFTFRSFLPILRQYGLHVLPQALYLPNIHGGSVRVIASKALRWSGHRLQKELWDREKDINLATLREFANRIQLVSIKLREMIRELRWAGKTISGYGAPAKATILLNYSGIGLGQLDFITDTTPSKQSQYIPGLQIPIISPETASFTDYKLLLAWNYEREIVAKEKDYIQQDGRFIAPFPEPHIVP